MPITITYDVTDVDNNDRNRIRSVFERFGWEHVGGSAFRYPRFEELGTEDWLNCVVPALFFLRSFVLAKSIALQAFTLDTHAASWIKGTSGAPVPEHGTYVRLAEPGNVSFSADSLRDWLRAVVDHLR